MMRSNKIKTYIIDLMPLKLRKSNRPEKKWVAKDENRTIHFGQKNARDFTQF